MSRKVPWHFSVVSGPLQKVCLNWHWLGWKISLKNWFKIICVTVILPCAFVFDHTSYMGTSPSDICMYCAWEISPMIICTWNVSALRYCRVGHIRNSCIEILTSDELYIFYFKYWNCQANATNRFHTLSNIWGFQHLYCILLHIFKFRHDKRWRYLPCPPQLLSEKLVPQIPANIYGGIGLWKPWAKTKVGRSCISCTWMMFLDS